MEKIHRDNVAKAILEVLQVYYKHYQNSIFADDESLTGNDSGNSNVLVHQQELRLKLIQLIAKSSLSDFELNCLYRQTPELTVIEDFGRLIQIAISSSVESSSNHRCLNAVRQMDWPSNPAAFEYWFQYRETEPIKSNLAFPLSIDLNSQFAIDERNYARRRNVEQEKHILDPPPLDRVKNCLEAAENTDVLYFRGLVSQFSLKPDSTHYGFQRQIRTTELWGELSRQSKNRIVKAAKKYLIDPRNDDPRIIEKSPLSSIHTTSIAAFWLIVEEDKRWLYEQPEWWWELWAWTIMRETIIHLAGENDSPKRKLFRVLYDRAAESIRERIRRIVTGKYKKQVEQAASLLSSTFDLIIDFDDSDLDELLVKRISNGKISSNLIYEVASFVAHRCEDKRVKRLLKEIEQDKADVHLITALLKHRFRESWPVVNKYLESKPDAKETVISRFCQSSKRFDRESDLLYHDQNVEFLGELSNHVFDVCEKLKVPLRNKDPDSVWSFRNEIVNWLSYSEGSQVLIERKLKVLTGLGIKIWKKM